MQTKKTYKRYAFISYKRTDSVAARMLSLRMSCYRLPNNKANEFCNSRRLTPVYRDRENLTSGELTPQLMEALDTAKYLIVFCTKSSLEGPWINKEVAHFLTTHDISQIIPYIPPAKEEQGLYYVPALQSAIDEKTKENPEYVFLGISHQQEELELGFLHRLCPWLFRYEKSYVRVIARTLDLEFNSLWDEHKKFLRRVIRSIIGTILFFLLLLAYFGVPISAPIKICETVKNDSLPTARNAVLIIGDAKYSLNTLDTTITIKDIPGKYRFREIPIQVEATYYKPISQSLYIGKGFGNQYTLYMERDSTFAVYYGIVTDRHGFTITEAEVTIGKKHTRTDMHGTFRIIFNVEEQSQTKPLLIEKTGVGRNYNAKESPDSSRFILK